MALRPIRDSRLVTTIGVSIAFGILVVLPLGCGSGGGAIGEASNDGRLSTGTGGVGGGGIGGVTGGGGGTIPTPTPTPTPFPGQNLGSKFLLVTYPEPESLRNTEIYSIQADGTNRIRLTNNSETDTQPQWSPDGTTIVFVHMRLDSTTLRTINPDGTGERLLTQPEAGTGDQYPMWSPDGTKVLFQNGAWPTHDIFVVNRDGSGRQRLTNTGDNWFPAWSPDGTKIVFYSTRDWDRSDPSGLVNAEIYVMNADGSNVQRLTHMPGNQENPRWSPDGAKIAFQSGGQVWVMNADGSNPTKLTQEPSGAFQPVWSPDSQWLLFGKGSGNGMYRMKVDGTEMSAVTFPESLAGAADWWTP